MYQETGDGSSVALFVTGYSSTGTRVLSTILGARAYQVEGYLLAPQVAADSAGSAYIAAWATPGAKFPVTPGAYQTGPKTTATTYSYDATILKVVQGPKTVRLSATYQPGTTRPLIATVMLPAAGGTIDFWETAPGGTQVRLWGSAPVVDDAARLTVDLPVGVHRLQAFNPQDGSWSDPIYEAVSAP